MKDFGYDVSDFRDIDPLFGTMADFEELAAGCKERGMSLSKKKLWDHLVNILSAPNFAIIAQVSNWC